MPAFGTIDLVARVYHDGLIQKIVRAVRYIIGYLPMTGMALDGHVPVRQVSQPSRETKYINHRARGVDGVRTGPHHLAKHGYVLRRILRHRNQHPGVIHHMRLDQSRFNRARSFDGRERGQPDLPTQHERELSRIGHARILIQIRRVKHLDIYLISRTDEQAFLLRKQSRGQAAGQQNPLSSFIFPLLAPVVKVAISVIVMVGAGSFDNPVQHHSNRSPGIDGQ